MQIFYVLSFLILILIVLKIHYFTDIYKSTKYLNILKLFTALGVFGTIYIIYLQTKNRMEDTQNQTTQFYMDIMQGIFDDSLKFFAENPDMDYFFENIFNNKPIPNNINRNLIKEQIICFHIMSECANYAYYFKNHIKLASYSETVTQQSYRVIRIINNFLKSDIFKAYAIMYINKYAGFGNQVFFKEFFNLVATTKQTDNYQKLIAKSNIVNGEISGIATEEQKKNPPRGHTWKVIYDPNEKI
jgi:hypothetical protein